MRCIVLFCSAAMASSISHTSMLIFTWTLQTRSQRKKRGKLLPDNWTRYAKTKYSAKRLVLLVHEAQNLTGDAFLFWCFRWWLVGTITRFKLLQLLQEPTHNWPTFIERRLHRNSPGAVPGCTTHLEPGCMNRFIIFIQLVSLMGCRKKEMSRYLDAPLNMAGVVEWGERGCRSFCISFLSSKPVWVGAQPARPGGSCELWHGVAVRKFCTSEGIFEEGGSCVVRGVESSLFMYDVITNDEIWSLAQMDELWIDCHITYLPCSMGVRRGPHYLAFIPTFWQVLKKLQQ